MENLLYINLILIALLCFTAGFREVEILCARGSWSWKKFKSWFWFTNQDNYEEKNKDSFHISNSIIFLVIAFFIAQLSPCLGLIIDTVIYWIAMMYLRNITMHCIMPKWEKNNQQLRLWFLVPVFGSLLDKHQREKQAKLRQRDLNELREKYKRNGI